MEISSFHTHPIGFPQKKSKEGKKRKKREKKGDFAAHLDKEISRVKGKGLDEVHIQWNQ